jgi:hypothetical protein
MNLRLRPEAEAALRAEAERSGRSQQEIVREAVDHLLDLGSETPSANDRDALIAAGAVHPPRRPYRRVTPSLVLPGATSTLDLLDRDDRI